MKALHAAIVDDHGRVPIKAARLIAFVHWCRYEALPAEKGEEELSEAIRWFSPIAETQPWLVPKPLMGHLADDRAAPFLGEPDAAVNRAMELFFAALNSTVIESLSEAIDGIRALTGVIPEHHPNYLYVLYSLGFLLRSRFESAGTAADINQAIELGLFIARLNEVDPGGDQRRSRYLSGLALALISRYEHFEAVEDLNMAAYRAMEAMENAVEVGDGFTAMHVLCRAQQAKFALDRDPADLDLAIELGRMLANHTGPSDFDLAARLTLLQLALHTRFEQTGSDTDLAEAIEAAESAVEASHAEDAHTLSNLGIVLRSQYERHGEPAALDRAIDLMRRARDTTPVSDPNHCVVASNLAAVLASRFEHSGDRRDIDEAAAAARSAVGLVQESSIRRGGILSTLGTILRRRFDDLDDAADLDEAIGVTREALKTVSGTNTMQRRSVQGNLSGMLVARYRLHRAPQDLEEAVTFGRASVTEDSGRWHPAWTTLLSNFAGVLTVAYGESGELGLLDEAIAAAASCLEATPDGAADVARQASNLGEGHLQRYRATGNAADLSRAIELAKKAHALTVRDDSREAYTLLRLLAAAKAEYERTGAADELDRACDLAGRAVESARNAARDRIMLSIALARTLSEQGGPAAALPFYRKAIDLIPLVARRDLETDDRLRLIDTSTSTLAGEAAACAVATGDLELAVTLLDRGRGVLWGSLLDTRTELDALSASYPEIAEEFDRCRIVFDRRGIDGLDRIGMGFETDALDREVRGRAVRRLDELIGVIRGLEPTSDLPHPERFLQPTPLSELLPPAGTGPVVMLNAIGGRCDALVVDSEGVDVVGLDISDSVLEQQVAKYLYALQVFGTGDALEQIALETECRQVLRWLWHEVTGPVLDHLGHRCAPQGHWPRVWWCPTGLFSILPLHAAHDPAIADAGVLDRVVSSYTPTLRSLAHARRAGSEKQDERMLVSTLSDMPDSGTGPRFASLPGARAEHELLCQMLPPHRRTELTGAQVTHKSLVNELGRHRWAHLSCHGVQDLRRPAAGGLVPFDWAEQGLVGANDLFGASGTAGDFVFLSACQTATGGVSGVNEAINLASAMHYGGWRHVIGTLWTVDDGAAHFVAGEIYGEMIEDGRLDPARSPFALHRAVRRLREQHPARHSLWGRFVHLGP
ncbi:CHAT domain-containing protein [Glycomyces sp. NPDC047010]|uniref:CHAT domain-containing protein n=1 Tax=Glycomyces sp. NPDC047010 TaxID=3155023 RepID=UPI003409FFC3